jgi:hypothetical protein
MPAGFIADVRRLRALGPRCRSFRVGADAHAANRIMSRLAAGGRACLGSARDLTPLAGKYPMSAAPAAINKGYKRI